MAIQQALNPVTGKQQLWAVVHRLTGRLVETCMSRKDARDVRKYEDDPDFMGYDQRRHRVVRLDYKPVFSAR